MFKLYRSSKDGAQLPSSASEVQMTYYWSRNSTGWLFELFAPMVIWTIRMLRSVATHFARQILVEGEKLYSYAFRWRHSIQYIFLRLSHVQQFLKGRGCKLRERDVAHRYCLKERRCCQRWLFIWFVARSGATFLIGFIFLPLNSSCYHVEG